MEPIVVIIIEVRGSVRVEFEFGSLVACTENDLGRMVEPRIW